MLQKSIHSPAPTPEPLWGRLGKYLLAMVALAAVSASGVTDTLIPFGSTWKYLDNNSNQGTAWVAPGFNDTSWSSGPAQLGYGDGDEATVLSYGPNGNDKYMTTYFRHSFSVADPSIYTVLNLGVIRDDGVIVYVNGTEVFRNNMPDGAVAYNTYALQAVGGSDESFVYEITVNPALLVSGNNVVAAEIHQADATSSDISFDFQLTGSTDPVINQSPTVSITSPADNAFYAAPANLVINALAADNDGSVSLVEFYQDATKLGQDPTLPYTFNWNSVGIGNYTLTAVATDNLGAQTTSAVTHVTINVSTAPTIASVSPTPGAVSSLKQITVTFNEPVSGVDAGDLLINGQPASSVSGSGAVYTFDVAQPAEGVVWVGWDGSHGIADFENPPKPFDAHAGGSAWQYTFTDTVAPTIAQLTPIAGADLDSLTKITMTFSETVFGVNAADLLVNNVPASGVKGFGAGPYEFTVTQPPNGPVNVTWAGNHGIVDTAAAANAFAGASWNYTLNTNAVYTGQIVINEIMYHPSSERTDEEYIELLNRGAYDVNLTGWKFTRGVNFTFPTVTLASDEYLVVAADVTRFHAKYPSVANVVGGWTGQLSNSGEDVELEDASGNRVDLVSYADDGDFALRRPWPQDTRGLEWYAEHDGVGKSLELRNPALPNNHGQNWLASTTANGTPGQRNSVFSTDIPPMILGVTHFPAIPKSDHEVTITAQIVDESTTGLTVTLFQRNATSASPPDFSSQPMFDDGLHNDGVAGDGVYGAVLSPMGNHTVIEFYVQATDAASHTRTWPAAAQQSGGSLAQTANASFQVDDETYSGPQPFYRVIMTQAERNGLDGISHQSDAQFNFTLVTIDQDDVQIRYNCGIRYRGAGSRGRNPPSYRLNIPNDRRWNGKSGMNLNSQYTHAQLIGSKVAQKAGLPAANCRVVQFRVNGQNLASSGSPQYGSYVHVEPINTEFADVHSPTDSAGNVYRASSGSHSARLNYLGTDPNSYINAGIYKTSNVSENDWSDMFALTFALDPATTPANAYVQAVRQNANVEMWMRYFAVLSLMEYSETALGTGYGDDFALYRGVLDPRFVIVSHDYDTIFGEGDTSGNVNENIFIADRLPIVDRFLHNAEFEPIYYAELRHQLETAFSTDSLDSMFDEFLADWIPASVVARMKSFVAARNAYVLSQLPAAPVVIQATLSGEPPAATYLTSATLTVGGPNITHYRYRLNNGAFGPETPVGTPIQLSGLTDGLYTVYVIGRNAAGTWQSTAAPTISKTWTVLSGRAGVVINEVLARNDSAVDHEGTFPDMIELFNAGSATANLEGLRLTDDLNQPNKFTFPAGTALDSGNYLVLYANSSDGTPGLHLGFALNQDGETLYFLDTAAHGERVLDSVEFGLQLPDLSIGRLGTGQWGLCSPTFGSANSATATGSAEYAQNQRVAGECRPYLD